MNLSEFLRELFPFRELQADEMQFIEKRISPEIRRYQKGMVIYSPNDFEKKIGFVLCGECEVVRLREGGSVPLNTLLEYDSFGVLALFSEKNRFPTEVHTKKDSSVVFFDKADVLWMIQNSPKIAMSFIEFLANRVDFLNEKIGTLAASSVEEKLLSYLISESEKNGTDLLTLNFKRTAELLNCGRASLYRALDSLCNEGIIIQQKNTIKLKCPSGRERKEK